MTQQTGYRPAEAQGVAANVKDRISDMADTATDKVKDMAESAQDREVAQGAAHGNARRRGRPRVCARRTLEEVEHASQRPRATLKQGPSAAGTRLQTGSVGWPCRRPP
jgi:hypothetical protein